MRRFAVLAVTLALAGCTTPLDVGEKRYRDGDRLGALEQWRDIPQDSFQYESARKRIAEVEDEFQQLVVRYKQRARYFERKERLAESILNYRLAAKLEPKDRATMAHVQELSRLLAARKDSVQSEYTEAFQRGDLPSARARLATLRALDPFDSELEADRRAFDTALRGRVDDLLTRGRQGFTSGRLGEADQAFRAVLELDPENASAQGYLSYIAAMREDDAAPRPRSTTSVLPRPPLDATEAQIRAEGFHQNALAAERRGEPFAAIQQDLRALEADKGHAGAKRHLVMLRQKLSPDVDGLIDSGRTSFREEDLQGALDQWRRALLVDPGNERALGYVARTEKLLDNLEQLRADPDAAGPRR